MRMAGPYMAPCPVGSFTLPENKPLVWNPMTLVVLEALSVPQFPSSPPSRWPHACGVDSDLQAKEFIFADRGLPESTRLGGHTENFLG